MVADPGRWNEEPAVPLRGKHSGGDLEVVVAVSIFTSEYCYYWWWQRGTILQGSFEQRTRQKDTANCS
jgi:hypothetical protein